MHSYFPAVDKEDIMPPVPALTRYRRESGIKAFVKKEFTDPKLPDARWSTDVNVLTTPTLCVQLNTLYVSAINSNPFDYVFFCFFWAFNPLERKGERKELGEKSRFQFILVFFFLISLSSYFLVNSICSFFQSFLSQWIDYLM